MRLLIFLLVIGGISYFAANIFRGKGDGGMSKGLTSGAAAGLTSAIHQPGLVQASASPGIVAIPGSPVISPFPASPGISPFPASLGIASPGIPVFPICAESYIFRNRALPSSDYFTQISGMECKYALDPVTRMVSFFGSRDAVSMASAITRAADLVPSSCSVRAWVVFVESSRQSGWDLSAAIGSVIDPIGFSAGSTPRGAIFSWSAGDISASLDLIASNGDLSVVQRPHVLLVDGEVAIVESIREVPIPSVTLSSTFSQSSVTYRKVGLQMQITPRFLAGDRVHLTVSQENGLIGPSVSIGTQSIPSFDTQRVSTSLEMSIGQSVVLGGVASDRVEVVTGLLSSHEERRSGSLYVVLSTAADSPRAVPVGSLPLPSPALVPVPFSSAVSVLPPKGWKSLFR